MDDRAPLDWRKHTAQVDMSHKQMLLIISGACCAPNCH
jgi:hypothetical protein